jgi:hypothetical protein
VGVLYGGPSAQQEQHGKKNEENKERDREQRTWFEKNNK